MAMVPARRGGRNLTLLDPSREFEDIYDRMGHLMNAAFGDLGLAKLADVPWSPLAEVSETDDAYIVHVELPGVHKDQVDVQLQDRELVITGAFRYANTWPTAIELAASGRVDLDSMVTGHFGLADVEVALTASRSDPTAIKVMVKPGE